MPLTIPNTVDATYADQAAPDSRDVDAIVAGFSRTGVVSGCAVTQRAAGANMSVDIAAGTVSSAAVIAAVTAGNVAVTTADATNPRYDIVVASSAGVKSVQAGTAAAIPAFPTIPAGSVLLAAVYVPANATSVTTGQIVDKRVQLTRAVTKVVAEAHADAGAANLNTEQTLASLTLPGGLVAAGDIVKLICFGDLLNNSGSSITYTPKVKIGATTVLTGGASTVTASATRRSWKLEVECMVAATNAERVIGKLTFGGLLTSTFSNGGLLSRWDGYGTAAEDLTADAAFVFTNQMGTANASADMILHAAYLQHVPKV